MMSIDLFMCRIIQVFTLGWSRTLNKVVLYALQIKSHLYLKQFYCFFIIVKPSSCHWGDSDVHDSNNRNLSNPDYSYDAITTDLRNRFLSVVCNFVCNILFQYM